MALKLARRSFLKGIGGAAIGLPFLEVMMPSRALAQSTAPVRYVVAFGGMSIGGDCNVNPATNVIPATTGTGYALTRGLRPLGGRATDSKYPWESVKDAVTVVSGLRIPVELAGNIPSGGRVSAFHSSTMAPLLSGTKATQQLSEPTAPSSDQLAAATLKGTSRFASLQYRVQAQQYHGGVPVQSRISYARNSSGAIVPLDPIASPRLAYEQLFTDFSAPDTSDPAEVAARRRALEQQRSVIDLVRSSSDRLKARLGRSDSVRLERHFDEIRAIEQRLGTIPSDPLPGSVCETPTHPGNDPAATYAANNEGLIMGWSDETKRGRVLSDLIHMALACDQTRVASMMITYAQTYMSAQALFGARCDIHELGHCAGSPGQMSDAVAWHVEHLAYLVDKLRSTPEGDGTLLDSTVLALVFEGGSIVGSDGSHSSDRMVALVAGRPSKLRLGMHVATNNAHPASVLLSCVRAAGVTGAMGDIAQPLDALLV